MQKPKSIKRELKKEVPKYKKHSGITLIALVITIIVLLILAGVALVSLFGENGILNNAESAKKQTDLANAKEQVALAVTGAMTYPDSLGEVTKTNLVTELNNIIGEEKYTIIPDDETGPWTITVGKYETIVSGNGENREAVLELEGTTPWIPAGFSRVGGTDLVTGLVITNKTDGTIGNQNYVWIEVLNNIERTITINGTQKTTTLTGTTTNEEIAEWLEVYAGKGTEQDYTKGSSSQDYSSWKDEWYDKYHATWDGVSEYALINNESSSNFSRWEDYYGEGNVYYSTTENGEKQEIGDSTYSSDNYYFAKAKDNSTFQNHTDGCGMTYSQYQKAYSNMLKSIKKHGGFWLAQYEAGIAYEAEDAETATNRTSHTTIGENPSPANYAKDQYPYNYVYCSEAQKIANADSTNEYTSSLPFGIQWDLVCKFLEVKTSLEYKDIATQSTWGNYYDTLYTPNRTAKYSEWRYDEDEDEYYFTSLFEQVSENSYSKAIEMPVGLTTGAIEQTTAIIEGVSVTKDSSPMNIYDFVGNVFEWSLERVTTNTANACASRGGYYHYNSSFTPASYRLGCYTEHADFGLGFRSVLY